MTIVDALIEQFPDETWLSIDITVKKVRNTDQSVSLLFDRADVRVDEYKNKKEAESEQSD